MLKDTNTVSSPLRIAWIGAHEHAHEHAHGHSNGHSGDVEGETDTTA